MTDIERYLRAATRDNTRRSYQAAIEHFESHWGGFLPATAESIARYLVDHADQHAVSTLRQRLAALSQWHVAQGFPTQPKRRWCVRCCAASAPCTRHPQTGCPAVAATFANRRDVF